MNVGLVIYGPLDARSGGYLYDAKVVEYLRREGDTVRVFSLPEAPYARRFTHNLRVGFWRRLARANLDVLLQDELNHPSLVFGNRWLRRRVTYPLVAVVHHLFADEWEDGQRRQAVARLERAYLAGVDAVVCNSRSTLRRVRGLGVLGPGGVAPPGGDRLGPPLSEAAIRRRAHAPGPLRVLFLGNVIPRKRLGLVLRGLAQLPARMWRLEVVGSRAANPAYAHRMQRLAGTLGVEARVDFRGRVSDAALRAALEASHVLAVPSRHEGFGIAYLEAMGHGIAVIANKKSVPEELIQADRNGLLVDERPSALAAAVRALYDDRAALARYGCNARAFFAAQPTWHDTGAAVRDFLTYLAAIPPH